MYLRTAVKGNGNIGIYRLGADSGYCIRRDVILWDIEKDLSVNLWPLVTHHKRKQIYQLLKVLPSVASLKGLNFNKPRLYSSIKI